MPLAALKGRTFSGRVAASLLAAHGFPDLITENEADYFKLALEITTNEARRLVLKDRLEQARQTSSLFNTERFTGRSWRIEISPWNNVPLSFR